SPPRTYIYTLSLHDALPILTNYKNKSFTSQFITMKRKFIIIGIVVVIFGGIAYQLAANKKIINERKEIDHQEVVIPVTTTITSYQEVNHQLIKTGTLIPFKEA